MGDCRFYCCTTENFRGRDGLPITGGPTLGMVYIVRTRFLLPVPVKMLNLTYSSVRNKTDVTHNFTATTYLLEQVP